MLRQNLFLVIFLSFLSFPVIAGYDVPEKNGHNCFTIMVGKNATEDGSVLFAHIEDDFGKQLVNWYVKDAQAYNDDDIVELKNGGIIPQVNKTAKMLWLEIPGMDFSDSYLNEFGVCIASNSCASREKDPEITDGGISYGLRRIMAERATSAKEAVMIGGALVEKFGYTGSGRTYCIADANEAWTMAVVRGKHWVAQRVPDDHVMILPNNYVIGEINLDDTDSFLACNDLIDYAIKKEWYNPDSDGRFNFRNTYAAENSLSHPGNTSRAWGAYHKFDMTYNRDDSFPYSFKPRTEVNKEMLMDIFAYHYEGTELDRSKNYSLGSPYELNGSMICGKASVYGFVTELRDWMPTDIGCLMWLAPQWPDIQPFIPWYCGIQEIPEGYSKEGYLNDLSDHYNPPEDIHERYDGHAFWSFVELSDYVNEDYGTRINKLRKTKHKIEKKLLRRQYRTERLINNMYQGNKQAALDYITQFTANWAKVSWSRAEKLNK